MNNPTHSSLFYSTRITHRTEIDPSVGDPIHVTFAARVMLGAVVRLPQALGLTGTHRAPVNDIDERAAVVYPVAGLCVTHFIRENSRATLIDGHLPFACFGLWAHNCINLICFLVLAGI